MLPTHRGHGVAISIIEEMGVPWVQHAPALAPRHVGRPRVAAQHVAVKGSPGALQASYPSIPPGDANAGQATLVAVVFGMLPLLTYLVPHAPQDTLQLPGRGADTPKVASDPQEAKQQNACSYPISTSFSARYSPWGPGRQSGSQR